MACQSMLWTAMNVELHQFGIHAKQRVDLRVVDSSMPLETHLPHSRSESSALRRTPRRPRHLRRFLASRFPPRLTLTLTAPPSPCVQLTRTRAAAPLVAPRFTSRRCLLPVDPSLRLRVLLLALSQCLLLHFLAGADAVPAGGCESGRTLEDSESWSCDSLRWW